MDVGHALGPARTHPAQKTDFGYRLEGRRIISLEMDIHNTAGQRTAAASGEPAVGERSISIGIGQRSVHRIDRWGMQWRGGRSHSIYAEQSGQPGVRDGREGESHLVVDARHASIASGANEYVLVCCCCEAIWPSSMKYGRSRYLGGEDSWGSGVTARAHTYRPYFLSSFVFVGVNNGGNKLSPSLSSSSSHLVFPSI